MLSIIGTILSALGPVIGFFIKIFLKNKEAQAKAVKNYYKFIAQIDKKSDTKVANYLATETALAKVQREIREAQLIEPERIAERVKSREYDVPEIIELDIEVDTHGEYLTDSGRAKGLVVHFTAGRFANGRQDAVNTLTDLAKRGYGCLVMDINGQIYKAQSIDDIAWHAGKSAYLGYEGMSRYLMGMEICCGGKLEDDGKTWYGLLIDSDEQRAIAKQNKNQKHGLYHKFTVAQEKSLVNFVRWQFDINPEFSLDFVIGHDECAPDRKNDPGGSLSMTMPDFRAMIKTMI